MAGVGRTLGMPLLVAEAAGGSRAVQPDRRCSRRTADLAPDETLGAEAAAARRCHCDDAPHAARNTARASGGREIIARN